MKTKHYIVDKMIDDNTLNDIRAAILQGEVIAIPTETVYGLAANALDEQAVQKIYSAKGRPSDNPLILHISDISQMSDFVNDISQQVQTLMTAFWPGPITFILPLKSQKIAPSVSAGLNTVAVRMPNHPITKQIIQAVGLPLAAPSANSSGKPSPTTAKHVLDDLNGKIYGVVDSGQAKVGLESTVLDCTRTPMVIVRPGAITQTMLQQVLQQPIIYEEELIHTQPIAPGMKYKHYAPHQPLTIVKGNVAKFKKFINEQQYKVGVLAFIEDAIDLPEGQVYYISQNKYDILQASKKLYEALRYFDLTDCEMLYIREFEASEETRALNNRLLKASNYRILNLDN